MGASLVVGFSVDAVVGATGAKGDSALDSGVGVAVVDAAGGAIAVLVGCVNGVVISDAAAAGRAVGGGGLRCCLPGCATLLL